MSDRAKSHRLPWPIGPAQYRRIHELASKMLADFPRVRQMDDTSDVAHTAMIRLTAALQSVEPESELHFWRMVALQIRRTLQDLARQARRMVSLVDHAKTLHGADKHALHQANWAEFHERTAQLPQPQREVLELYYYAGLSQEQVADLLDLDVRTIQRRWRRAKLSLHQLVFECVPTSAIHSVPRNGKRHRDE